MASRATRPAAYLTFCDAIDIDCKRDAASEPDPAYFIASDAERDVLFELCSYPCRSIEEAGAKAAYLLTTADGRDDNWQLEYTKALLESFLADDGRER